MEKVMEIIGTDVFLLILVSIVIILLIGFAVLIVRFSNLNKRYKNFMEKLGQGKNIEEDLENYMYRVDKVERKNTEISNQVEAIEHNLTSCIQKIGMVRYNAFKDVGSDLSFALALLDEKNNGVVLNGIYAREMSNIYAKPIENGKSTYVVSEEEAQAIEKAIGSE